MQQKHSNVSNQKELLFMQHGLTVSESSSVLCSFQDFQEEGLRPLWPADAVSLFSGAAFGHLWAAFWIGAFSALAVAARPCRACQSLCEFTGCKQARQVSAVSALLVPRSGGPPKVWRHQALSRHSATLTLRFFDFSDLLTDFWRFD